MAGRNNRVARQSSKGLRSAALAALLAAACYVGGPSFSVKGGWDGQLGDVKNLPAGLGPQGITGLAFGQRTDTGNLNISVQDGRLVVNYGEGPLSLRMDDAQAWQANFTRDDTTLRISGQALEDLTWAISKQAEVGGLGKVDLNVSSDQSFGVAVMPALPDLKSVPLQLRTTVQSHGSDVAGRLEAETRLADKVDVRYNVENEEGVYELSRLSHDASFQASLDQDSDATLKLSGNGKSALYNATYRRAMDQLLKGDSEAVVGIDNGGVYGSLVGSRGVGRGLTAGYAAQGRSAIKGAERSGALAASLSHNLGKLTLLQSSGANLSARLESDVTRGAMRAQGKLEQSVGGGKMAAPSFNVSLSRDLSDLLGSGASAQLGIDDATLDGVYANLAARRNLGTVGSVEYSSSGRLKGMEHAVRVANDLGYARLVKRGADAPRLQLGYQFEA